MSVVLVLDFWVPTRLFHEEFRDYLAATVLLAISCVVQSYFILLAVIQEWPTRKGSSLWRCRFRKKKPLGEVQPTSRRNFFSNVNVIIFLLMTFVTILYSIRFAVYTKRLRRVQTRDRTVTEVSIMSIAYLSIMNVAVQLVLYAADFLMIYRCYIVTGDSQLWICISASLLFVISIGTSLMTLIIGIINTTSFSAAFPINERLRRIGYYTPIISTASSVGVNVIVTVALVVRILSSHKKMANMAAGLAFNRSLLGATTPPRTATRRKNNRLKTTSALLIESALPAALCGLIVCALYPFVDNGIHLVKAPRFLGYPKYSIRVLWFSCTALAPQLIMVRVLRKRDTHTISRSDGTSGQAVSALQFATGSELNPEPSSDLSTGQSL